MSDEQDVKYVRDTVWKLSNNASLVEHRRQLEIAEEEAAREGFTDLCIKVDESYGAIEIEVIGMRKENLYELAWRVKHEAAAKELERKQYELLKAKYESKTLTQQQEKTQPSLAQPAESTPSKSGTK